MHTPVVSHASRRPGRLVLAAALTLCAACWSEPEGGGEDDLREAQLEPASANPPGPPGPVTLTFDTLANTGKPVTRHAESGFDVTTAGASWVAMSGYGSPAPALVFSEAATGSLEVRAAGAPFGFHSVDLYASVIPIPYELVGLRGGQPVFTLKGTVPNTYGAFKTVTNPDPQARIDTLVVRLTNAPPPCCSNPMGVDTLALER